MSYVTKVCFGLSLVLTSPIWARVSISSPTDGTTVASPVLLKASAIGNSVPVSMLVYDNGSLLLQQQGVSSIQSSLTLSAGEHTLLVVAKYGRSYSSSSTSTIKVSPPTSGGGGGGGGDSNSTLATQIANDMTGQNEGNPHGVPLSWDWAVGPVMGLGNTPPKSWTAITAWGVAYVAAQGNPAVNTRVNIRMQQCYVLSASTGRWSLVQSTSDPDGAAYLEDFSGDSNAPADIRNEPDGSISVVPGGGYNFHFYPDTRGSINPSDIAGIVTLFEARLIVDNPSLPDDRSIAQFLAGSGADYWPDLTSGMPAGQTVEPAVANGKMKYVQSSWRSFAMTTMTQAQLASNPPPVNLNGILP